MFTKNQKLLLESQFSKGKVINYKKSERKNSILPLNYLLNLIIF